MKTSDSIRSTMTFAKNFFDLLITDMEDAPLTRPVPGGNHPYWLLGHMVVSEGGILDRYVLDQPDRFESWRSLFDGGTTPSDNMNGGPTFSELRAALDSARVASFENLDSLSDDDLGKPCCKPDGPGPSFETVADCFMAMSSHMMFHTGQLADARRAAGRKPLFL